jgi:hypothetical protein
MAEPTISFGFNHNGLDEAWPGINPVESGSWKLINTATDLVVFTGGGILGALPTPTCTSGTRDATIRPSTTSYVIPQTYVEQDQMYITTAGHNVNRYVFGVRVNGVATSDIYLEAWDDNSFSTTDLEILTGTTNSSNNSFVNAIRTTAAEPPWGPGWDGNTAGAAFLRGTEHRVGLNNSSQIIDSTVYYNIYIRLETDCSTFHVMPVLGFRYLYT